MQAPSSVDAVIRLTGVTFGYGAAASGAAAVISGIDAELEPGRVTALLGPNASGKSTLLRLMLGQLAPWQGRVELLGRPAATMPADQRARLVSYVPQRGSASFAFTVEEVVAMGRFASQATTEDAVGRALDEVGAGGWRHRIFSELSGGQQQAVLVARALAQADGHGRAILLDEPGSSMDPRHAHELMAVLRVQAARGLAVLVVLHDINLAAGYADRVWLLHAGRLVAAGPWDAVLQPSVLEPVYGIGMRNVVADGDRPVFAIAPLADGAG